MVGNITCFNALFKKNRYPSQCEQTLDTVTSVMYGDVGDIDTMMEMNMCKEISAVDRMMMTDMQNDKYR